MENKIELIKEHKIKFIIAMFVTLISLTLVIWSLNKNDEIANAEKYKQHLITSNENSRRYKYNLLVYLDSIGSTLLDCDEDVAKMLNEFASNFKDEASNLNALVYVGEELVVDSDLYFDLSQIYEDIAKNLEDISNAINQKDKQKVKENFQYLKDNLMEIEDRDSL